MPDQNSQTVPALETIVPSVKKVMAANSLSLLIKCIIGYVVVFYGLPTLIDPSMFTDVFEQLEIEIDTAAIMQGVILVVVVFLLLMLLLKFLSVYNKKYLIYSDNIVIPSGFGTSEIPFANINRITLQSEGIFNGLFGLETINLELSGMKENAVSLVSIEKPNEVVQRLNARLQQFKLQQYGQQYASQYQTQIQYAGPQQQQQFPPQFQQQPQQQQFPPQFQQPPRE